MPHAHSAIDFRKKGKGGRGKLLENWKKVKKEQEPFELAQKYCAVAIYFVVFSQL